MDDSANSDFAVFEAINVTLDRRISEPVFLCDAKPKDVP